MNAPGRDLSAPRALRDPALPPRLVGGCLALLLLWPVLVACEFEPWRLWDAQSWQVTRHFLADFLPPAHDADFLGRVMRETWRTVAIATAGIVFGGCIAVPLALVATRTLSRSALEGAMSPAARALRTAVRGLLIVLRSVPELVWALAFVRVVGLGPAAGVLAIGLTYGGMLGKVYAEILESGETEAAHVLLRQGAGRLQALFYGLLPSSSAELTSYTVYRWECAIRSSVVLGIVGAGGLGQLMDGSLKMFAGGEVCTLLLVFVALVALADGLSRALRSADRATLRWVLAGVAATVIASFSTLDLGLGAFASADAWQAMARFFGEFAPPDLAGPFVSRMVKAGWETLAMSALGTLLATVFGLALAVPASAPLAGNLDETRRARRGLALLRAGTRWLLNGLRAVPELVWAALLLIAAGLGPLAGTLALAVHTTGVLGRLDAEAIENAAPGPALALRARGIGPLRTFFYATLPQILPQVLSYSLYRWENNIRAAAVLGVVGAGGLGQALTVHLGLFQMHKAATVLLGMLALVALVDVLSFAARRMLTR